MDELLNNFLLYLESAKGSSKNTIKNYELDIKELINYLSEKNIKDIQDIDYKELEFFVNHLTKKGNSPSTRARKISSIKGFFNYINDKLKITDGSPATELECPKLPKRNPKFLNIQQSKKMLGNIIGRNKERDEAIIILFLNLGLRVSELVNIDITDIKDSTIRLIRKGNEEKYLPLNNSCIHSINKYLKVRPKVDINALFISEQGKRINTNTVRYLTKKYGDINPHGLRHSCFSNLLTTGKVNIKQIQELANHKSIVTTSLYTHITGEEMRNTVDSNPY